MTNRYRIQRLVTSALLLGSLLLAVSPLPASAHTRYITDVFGSGLKGEEPGLRATAYLNRAHAGVMKFTLYKRAGGDWIPVNTKRGDKSEVNPVVYDKQFASPNANMCKFRARFTTDGHNTSQKSTPAFSCDGT